MLKRWMRVAHELAIYDLRSTMNYVYGTNKQKIIYIGYSMGTALSYIYASSYPKEASNTMKGIISFGPIGYLISRKSLLVWLKPVYPIIKFFTIVLFHGELLNPFGLISGVLRLMSHYPITMYMVEAFLSWLAGTDYSQMEPLYYPIMMNQLLDCTGVNVVGHVYQLLDSQKFQQYDYGLIQNLLKYGKTYPPTYPLSDITVPVSMFVGLGDILATEEGALKTYSELSPDVQNGFNLVKWDKWAHIDFVKAKDTYELLYKPALETISKLQNRP